METRQDWEIVWCLYLQVAASYLRYLTMDEGQRITYQSIYHTEDLHQWALERINTNIKRANGKVARHDGPGADAQSAAAGSVASLNALESSGIARIAGTTKIES